jgi:hypothetical protein
MSLFVLTAMLLFEYRVTRVCRTDDIFSKAALTDATPSCYMQIIRYRRSDVS